MPCPQLRSIAEGITFIRLHRVFSAQYPELEIVSLTDLNVLFVAISRCSCNSNNRGSQRILLDGCTFYASPPEDHSFDLHLLVILGS